MSENRNWQLELDEYIRQEEPEKKEKSEAWRTAIGLQAVDGLRTSEYLLETAKDHIEGKIGIDAVQKRIQSYYEERVSMQEVETDAREADIVSSRIAALLGERTFQFSPAEWQEIHRRLFGGVFDHAGQIRTYNVTKKEWVLKGESVLYAAYDSIPATMAYDFSEEKAFSYRELSLQEIVNHIAKFTSDIWQIHPFCEGNTRATAVFIIKYLKVLGFHVNNDAFCDYSWFFRNALVRANYNDLKNGVVATTKYLELFFENLLMGKRNELKNRQLHLDYEIKPEVKLQSAMADNSKCKNCTLNCTLEEQLILKVIAGNPSITQKELAYQVGKSERFVKTKTVSLQEKGFLRRVNGRRNGHWEILVDIDDNSTFINI